MKNNTIVTLADSNYFSMLEELIDSVKKHPESESVSICVLDAGLTSEQFKIIEKKVYKIKKANWDIEVPGYKTIGKEWLKSQVSRAFLPHYFPEFKKYLWIDCDAWINSWSCIELYFRACANGKLGITQTMGPGYRIMTKVKWIFGKIALVKSQNYKHAKSSGIKKNLKKTLLKGRVFGSEGLAINLSVYVDNMGVEFLPLYCNWILSNLLPKYDSDKEIFVEPNLPNYEIGIMHLAAGIWIDGKDMRLNKNLKINLETIDGKKILKSLRYES